MNIKPLADTRHYCGYTLTLISRIGNIAIFEYDNESRYDVVEVRVKPVPVRGQNRSNLNDRVYTHREAYPPTKEWGKRGFTYFSLKEAKEKQEYLVWKRGKTCLSI